MSIKDFETKTYRDLSTEPGHYQKILKSERFNLKMDFLPLSWVKVVPEHHEMIKKKLS